MWFSARAPCDGSSIPRVVARRNRHGARRFLRHVADGGGPVGGTALPRCVLGRMVSRRSLCTQLQAGGDSRMGCSLQHSPALVPAAHSTEFTLHTLEPSSQAPRLPQSPVQYSETARNWPKSQIFSRCAPCSVEGADNWSARLCVASRSAIKRTKDILLTTTKILWITSVRDSN